MQEESAISWAVKSVYQVGELLGKTDARDKVTLVTFRRTVMIGMPAITAVGVVASITQDQENEKWPSLWAAIYTNASPVLGLLMVQVTDWWWIGHLEEVVYLK